jgi:MscS family membrane protein
MLLTFWERTFYYNTMYQWAVALGIAMGAWVLARLIYWLAENVLGKMTARTESRLDDIVLETVKGPVVVLVTIVGMLAGYHRLLMTERLDIWMNRVFHAAIAITITWMIVRTLTAILRAYLVPYAERSDNRLDNHMVPVVIKGTSTMLWILGIIVALNNAGYDVGALLAGLGIGGLAMAMAAKDTVANVFGGITVFADKPFRIGDRIRLSGYDGTVIDVGIRSTRVRTLDGPVVVIPNNKFTESIVENVTQEPARRVKHELGLIYETPPEKMELAIQTLRDIAQDHQELLTPEVFVSFIAFRDYSLNILFIYHIRKEAHILDTQTKIHLEILRRFNAAGLSFAYPTAVELQGEYKMKT